MKTIGLIGGMSWESSLEYYRIVNEAVKARLGGLHSADCLMYSVNFAVIEAMQMAGQWDEAGKALVEAAKRLQAGGADCIVLCTNTMHKVTSYIEAATDLPFIHIADPTATAIKAQGIKTIGLLGTRFTMEQDFYKGRLTDTHGLNVLVPEGDDLELVHRVIYEELVLGHIKDESREAYVAVIEHLRERGAEGVILGCTEIGLLIKPHHTSLPTFDTTLLHAQAAVDFALEGVKTG